MSERPLEVVLVVDTGVDDALALVCAARHPRLRLSGVVATAGNVTLPRAVANTRHVLDLLDVGVPMGRGAARRADGRPFPPRPGHGPDGLAGVGPAAEPDDAALMALPTATDVLTGAPDASVVSCGPLTALLPVSPRPAFAVAARPEEANAALDPAAAALVRERWRLLDDDPTAFATCRVPGTAGLPSTGPGGLVRTLLEHQARRGAGLGDAGALLRWAGSTSEGEDLLRLLARR